MSTIPIKYIRSSSIGSFDMCPMKYFLNYTLGFPEYPHRKTVQGTIFHKVMEILASYKLAHQNQKDYHDDIIPTISHKEDLTTLNIEHIIEQCYDYYSKQFTKHEWTELQFKDCRKWIYNMLEFRNGEFDPRNQKIVEAEKHFKLKLNDEWAKDLELMGTIDLITDVGNNTYEIVDYKTGQRKNWTTGQKKTYKDLHNDFQLRFYHLAASMLYPHIKDILLTIFFINDGGPFTIPFSRFDISETVEIIKTKYEAIASCERPKPKYGFHCGFCQYSKETFTNTNVISIESIKDYKFSKKGQPMCICDQVHYVMDFRSLESIVKNMSKDNHDLNKYQAPGEI